MKVSELLIPGLLVLELDVFADERGYFMEIHREESYRALGMPAFVQDNESGSKQGVLRGLHYQLPPYGQGKLVRVIQGEVLDVVVDLRPSSKTFSQHFSIKLSAENHKQLWIPAGFAHGFLTLSAEAIFSYKCTASYKKEAERGLMWNDSELDIKWGTDDPILSPKDAVYPSLEEAALELK